MEGACFLGDVGWSPCRLERCLARRRIRAERMGMQQTMCLCGDGAQPTYEVAVRRLKEYIKALTLA